jgi:hypothetical protein
VISNEKKKVADYFNLDEINDKEKVAFCKDMMDIGIVESEEKEISDDSLPELYRYVYLNHKNNDQSLAVRVEDPDSGWKWIYEDKDDRGKLPISWKYPNSKLNSFIKEQNHGKWFDIAMLIQQYGKDSESNKNDFISESIGVNKIKIKNEINKEVFKEFSKLVMFLCNFSKRKVYIHHLKIMLVYYLCKYKSEKNGLIKYNINQENVEISFFNDYLNIMQKMGYVDLNKDFYGTSVIAKKKLEEKIYEVYQLKVLEEAIGKNIDDLLEAIKGIENVEGF